MSEDKVVFRAGIARNQYDEWDVYLEITEGDKVIEFGLQDKEYDAFMSNLIDCKMRANERNRENKIYE